MDKEHSIVYRWDKSAEQCSRCGLRYGQRFYAGEWMCWDCVDRSQLEDELRGQRKQ